MALGDPASCFNWWHRSFSHWIRLGLPVFSGWAA